MDDGVRGQHERFKRGAIPDIAPHVRRTGVGVRRPGARAMYLRLEIVEDSNLIAARYQPVDDVRADIARASRHKNRSNSHVRLSRLRMRVRALRPCCAAR